MRHSVDFWMLSVMLLIGTTCAGLLIWAMVEKTEQKIPILQKPTLAQGLENLAKYRALQKKT